MSDKECYCANCGSEADMTIVCDGDEEVKKKLIAEKKAKKEKVEAKLTCKNCGSEADMWINVD
ncbi:MAG: hypothetical protein GY714_05960 [Desulfobacterales bacterium]|nr:hypothetical protein [Desulfobacterales bacterium]MCP4164230.1 hypothetical protein [Deltaproteobacteria bacterium]